MRFAVREFMPGKQDVSDVVAAAIVLLSHEAIVRLIERVEKTCCGGQGTGDEVL